MFTVHALPAGNGDSLLLEYGSATEKHHILVDGGRSAFSKELIAYLEEHAPVLDLVVVTHVDLDHIGGVLDLLDEACPIEIKEIWFNGYVHLKPRAVDQLGAKDLLGPVEGEELSRRIIERGIPWNTQFSSGSVVIPDTGPVPEKTIARMKLTVLAPSWETLGALEPIWEPLVKGEGLVPNDLGPRHDDDDKPSDLLGEEDDLQTLADRPPPTRMTEANASSIALLAEYDDRRCLLAGDAAPTVMVSSLKRLSPMPYPVNLFKLPHHGSHGNVTSDLVQQVKCGKYLFTTNGTGYSNPHPHKEAVARVLVYGGRDPMLLFNYDCKTTRRWKTQDTIPCTVKYGTDGLLSEPV